MYIFLFIFEELFEVVIWIEETFTGQIEILQLNQSLLYVIICGDYERLFKVVKYKLHKLLRMFHLVCLFLAHFKFDYLNINLWYFKYFLNA